MKHANRISDGAFSYFRIGYNCAESVLLAIAKDALEIEVILHRKSPLVLAAVSQDADTFVEQ